MKRSRWIGVLAAGWPAWAQDVVLEPLVVTAARSSQPLADVPYSIEVLDAEYLRENTRRTLPEALQFTPGVLVQKTAHGHGSPFIRGFTGRQNLLLVDGVRVNNSTFRSGPIQYWNTIDSLSIDRLELIKSQGSVLYGSDAVGGTLNAFTKFSDFRARPAGAVYHHGAASYEYRTNGQGSHIGRLELETGVGGCVGIWLGLSAKDFGDLEDSAVGRMRGTGYPEQALDFRVDWGVTADSTLTLAHDYINQDAISRWHRTANNPGWVHGDHVAEPGTWTSNDYDQERSLTYLRYAGNTARTDAAIQNWSATLSYQSSDDAEFQNRLGDPVPGSRPIRGSRVLTDTYGVDVQLESKCGPGTWVYGLDWYHDEVASSGYQTNATDTNRRESLPIGDDSEYDLVGVFGQYTWQPHEAFELSGAARYTSAAASVGRYYNSSNVEQPGEDDHWNSLVGSLRAIYHFNPRWSVYGGLSQAFRAPNLDDLSGNLTSRAGDDSLGSADLDPETFLTWELGLRQQTDTWSLGVAAFYTDAEDLIVGVPVAAGSTTTVATNASDGYVYGFEVEGEWRFHPQWSLSGFAAWQDSRLSSQTYLGGPTADKPNARQLPITGSLALRWTHPSDAFWLEARVLAAAEEDRITTADQRADRQRVPTHGTPGYTVASLRAGWTVNDRLSLTGAVENITDQDYRSHGSGQNEPGVGAVLGARVTW